MKNGGVLGDDMLSRMWDRLLGKLARAWGWAFSISMIVSLVVFLFDRPLGRVLVGWVCSAWFFLGVTVIAVFIIWFLCAWGVNLIRARPRKS